MSKPSVVSGLSISVLTDSAPETFTLTWNQSTDNAVIGYNVYRGFIPETGEKINHSLITTTSFTTTTQIVPDVNFYWFVTAVNSFGEESDIQLRGITTENTKAFELNPITNVTDAFENEAYNDGEYMLDYYNEIRRRLLWVLENTGFNGALLKRKWIGSSHVDAMTRGNGLIDVMNQIDFGEKIDIKGVGDIEGNYNYVYGRDYIWYNTYGQTWTYIQWLSTGNSPSEGEKYFVRYQDINCRCYENEAGEGNKTCPICYGTWIQGGYVKFDMKMMYESTGDKRIEFTNMGFIPNYNPVIILPWTAHITTFDVIVDKTTNRRWEIVSVRPYPWRNLLIQQNVEVRLLPETHIIYQYPV